MKKLVVIMVGSITHLLRKDIMKVIGKGAEVGAEAVVVDVVGVVAVDLLLKDLLKSRLAGPSAMECDKSSLLVD